ncbi:unnamed protein product [Dracunculus medinensis]|uniref:Phosphoribosylaminoimidazolecarboxamide formyltransferase n=1 Tax=Dracunculus medinensis TaxID=318479 RepID=A0A0N4U6Z7_DRAME|nr:unnamed protein product [Dracunculus medinensis]
MSVLMSDENIKERLKKFFFAFSYSVFEHTKWYDEEISSYLRKCFDSEGRRIITLKYGINPQQTDAQVYFEGSDMPLKVLNGSPSYINILDALNSWQLVSELKKATGMPAAASFKHVSPAGAAIGLPLNESEAKSFMVADLPISRSSPSLAAAYARARGSDRMSSFGDFIALSDVCDDLTAKVISREVSDGIVAPAYDASALATLAKKRTGNYIILTIDPKFLPSETEERTIFGLRIKQKRNNTAICSETFKNILPNSAVYDLIIATVAVKYTQSNSVCFAYRGQVIGIGAGQQSRIHCTRLAAEKALNWSLRQHDRVLNLPWKANCKRIDKSNAIDMMITGFDANDIALEKWRNNFTEIVQPFSFDERKEWMNKMCNIVMSSDGFFPFRDNIDCASKYGVKYIASPGGSERDDDIIKACNEHGITLIHTGIRLFHH